MHYTFSVSFLSCQSCSSHSYCSQCAARWQEDLNALPELEQVTIYPVKKLLSVESPLTEVALTDLLDDKGIFIE